MQREALLSKAAMHITQLINESKLSAYHSNPVPPSPRLRRDKLVATPLL